MNFHELRAMYDRGQTDDVLKAISAMDASTATDEAKNLTVLKGWCHYRRKEYDSARDCAVAAGNFPWARELMAYLCAYAPKYINDETLLRIAEELGHSNVNIANAFVIRARAENWSLLSGAQVIDLVYHFRNDMSVHAANLHHNAGRFFLAKPGYEGGLRIAVKYLDEAIKRYRMEANFHHRAAANFWKSKALEGYAPKDCVVEAMQESVRLWDEQCKLDPTNSSFAQKRDEAKKRLSELLGI